MATFRMETSLGSSDELREMKFICNNVVQLRRRFRFNYDGGSGARVQVQVEPRKNAVGS